jgi:FkbM family methyltransferase
MKVRVLPTAAALFRRLPRALRRHRLMSLWIRLTGEDPVQLIHIRDRAFAYADMSDGFLRLIVIENNYEHDFFRLADAFLARGGVFFDIGANHGLLSLGLAAKHGLGVEFHLFEPNPILVSRIERSLRHYSGVKMIVNPVAVSDQVGSVSLLIDDEQSGASHVGHGPGHQVAAVTIDNYLIASRIDHVQLLKIDIEGYELVALRGAQASLRDRRIRAVYFEYFEKWLERVQPPSQLLAFFESLDFVVCFCRIDDLKLHGGATHTIIDDLPGAGIPLLPLGNHSPPAMTDLLAIPKENLILIP